MPRGSSDAVLHAMNSNEFKSKLEDIVKTFIEIAIKEYEKTVDTKFEQMQAECDRKMEGMKARFEETLAKYQKQIDEMADQIDNLEQYTRRECLLINGVKKTTENTSTQSTKNIVFDIMKSMKIDDKVVDRDIARTHWMGEKLVVKFATYNARELFYEKRKSAGEDIFVNESLTKRRNQLVFECRKLKKEKKILAVWTNDGVIKIKLLNGNNKVVKSLQEVQNLIM